MPSGGTHHARVALAAVGSRALEPAPIDRVDPFRILLLPSILLDVTSKYTRTILEYSHGQSDVIAEIIRAGPQDLIAHYHQFCASALSRKPQLMRYPLQIFTQLANSQ